MKSPRRRPRPRSATPGAGEGGHPLLRRFPWKRGVSVLLLVGLMAALLNRQIDVSAIHERAGEINGKAAFALLTLLPLVGFPASVLHVATGIRFGSVLGLTLVSASILLQLILSYVLVHSFRGWFDRIQWIHRVRDRIPRGAHPSLCVFAVMLPGAPYAAINYSLPLVGVPLRTYLLCCWPLHTLRATITVFLGDQSDHLTGARLAVLGGYGVLLLGASWWTFLRLRSQLGDPPAAAGDQKQPA